MTLPANWAPTLGGIIMGLPALLQQAGVVLSDPIIQLIMAVGGLVLGLAAKQVNVTGGTKSNTGRDSKTESGYITIILMVIISIFMFTTISFARPSIALTSGEKSVETCYKTGNTKVIIFKAASGSDIDFVIAEDGELVEVVTIALTSVTGKTCGSSICRKFATTHSFNSLTVTATTNGGTLQSIRAGCY